MCTTNGKLCVKRAQICHRWIQGCQVVNWKDSSHDLTYGLRLQSSRMYIQARCAQFIKIYLWLQWLTGLSCFAVLLWPLKYWPWLSTKRSAQNISIVKLWYCFSVWLLLGHLSHLCAAQARECAESCCPVATLFGFQRIWSFCCVIIPRQLW